MRPSVTMATPVSPRFKRCACFYFGFSLALCNITFVLIGHLDLFDPTIHLMQIASHTLELICHSCQIDYESFWC